jgi:hypothetical protein
VGRVGVGSKQSPGASVSWVGWGVCQWGVCCPLGGCAEVSFALWGGSTHTTRWQPRLMVCYHLLEWKECPLVVLVVVLLSEEVGVWVQRCNRTSNARLASVQQRPQLCMGG